jgi:CubicO group peptidase (beta-lactamase class C family)
MLNKKKEVTVKRQLLNKRFILRLSIVVFIFLHSINSFSQGFVGKDEALADSAANKIISDFLIACNSGERESMEDFVLEHYDRNALKRIPLFAVVSLNMSFYYETGGLGYEMVEMLPTTSNLVSAISYNKLTYTDIKLTVPLSNDPSPKINRFIKSESIIEEDQIKPLSDDEIVQRIEKCISKLQEDEEFSGAILVTKDGLSILNETIGDANKSFEIPNNINTKFNIASVGKVFTSLAIVQLADQGKLSYDDAISKYVPADWLDPAVCEKIQIKHLLTHTSGLGDYFKDAYMQCEVQFFRDIVDYKSLIADDTLKFEPGTNFSYSNTGFILLGVIIESITNESYFSYLRKNIFEPAGMENTDGFDKDYPVNNRATGYTKVYENDEVKWNNHQFTRILRGSPSGGIYSTTQDILKFANAINSNKLISPDSYEILMEGRPELNASFHSYGFFVSQGVVGRVASHKGDGRGMNCQFRLYLDSGYTVIVLSNYSAPSANIITNVIDQLINHSLVTTK